MSRRFIVIEAITIAQLGLARTYSDYAEAGRWQLDVSRHLGVDDTQDDRHEFREGSIRKRLLRAEERNFSKATQALLATKYVPPPQIYLPNGESSLADASADVSATCMEPAYSLKCAPDDCQKVFVPSVQKCIECSEGTNVPITAADVASMSPPAVWCQAIGNSCPCGVGQWCNSADNMCYESCYNTASTCGNSVPRLNTYFCDYSNSGGTPSCGVTNPDCVSAGNGGDYPCTTQAPTPKCESHADDVEACLGQQGCSWFEYASEGSQGCHDWTYYNFCAKFSGTALDCATAQMTYVVGESNKRNVVGCEYVQSHGVCDVQRDSSCDCSCHGVNYQSFPNADDSQGKCEDRQDMDFLPDDKCCIHRASGRLNVGSIQKCCLEAASFEFRGISRAIVQLSGHQTCSEVGAEKVNTQDTCKKACKEVGSRPMSVMAGTATPNGCFVVKNAGGEQLSAGDCVWNNGGGQATVGDFHLLCQVSCPKDYALVVGHISGNVRSSLTKATIDLCKQACDDGCQSFEYSPSTKQCLLNSEAEPNDKVTLAGFVFCSKELNLGCRRVDQGQDAPAAGTFTTDGSDVPSAIRQGELFEGEGIFCPGSDLEWYDSSSGWSSGSFNDAVTFCTSKGKFLCSRHQYCPNGDSVAGGTKQGEGMDGEQWVPYSGDGDNRWLQVGSGSSVCTSFSSQHHTFNPVAASSDKKKHVACCEGDEKILAADNPVEEQSDGNPAPPPGSAGGFPQPDEEEVSEIVDGGVKMAVESKMHEIADAEDPVLNDPEEAKEHSEGSKEAKQAESASMSGASVKGASAGGSGEESAAGSNAQLAQLLPLAIGGLLLVAILVYVLCCKKKKQKEAADAGKAGAKGKAKAKGKANAQTENTEGNAESDIPSSPSMKNSKSLAKEFSKTNTSQSQSQSSVGLARSKSTSAADKGGVSLKGPLKITWTFDGVDFNKLKPGEELGDDHMHQALLGIMTKQIVSMGGDKITAEDVALEFSHIVGGTLGDCKLSFNRSNTLKEIGPMYCTPVNAFKLQQKMNTALKEFKLLSEILVKPDSIPTVKDFVIDKREGYLEAATNYDKLLAESKGKGKGKEGKKGKKGKKGKQQEDTSAQDLMDRDLRCAILVQRAYRNYRKRKMEQSGGAQIQSYGRTAEVSQKIALLVDISNAQNLPNVNTFGGCDPFVEVRALSGADNPLDTKNAKGLLTSPTKYSSKTTVKHGDMHPRWDETLVLLGLSNKDNNYMILTVLDKNTMSSDKPICFYSMKVPDILLGLTYDPRRKGAIPKTTMKLDKMRKPEKFELCKTNLNISVSYVELHVYNLVIVSAKNLPKVDTIGSIDALIEARVVRQDPRVTDYVKDPEPGEVIWSGRTNPITNNVQPVWKKTFPNVELPGMVTWFIQFCLMNDNSPMPETAVGQFILPLKEVSGMKDPISRKGTVEKQTLKLERFPNIDAVGSFKKATLTIEVSYDIAFDK